MKAELLAEEWFTSFEHFVVKYPKGIINTKKRKSVLVNPNDIPLSCIIFINSWLSVKCNKSCFILYSVPNSLIDNIIYAYC